MNGRATRIGFTASDGTYTLDPQALDFPIPNANGMSDETLRYHAMYGTQLLADSAGLVHEAEVIDAALAAVGAGTDSNFTSGSVDPVAILDAQILAVMKAAKNGAPVKVLFGATALQRFRNNALVRGRITAGSKKSSNGSGEVSIQIGDVSNLLFGNPACEVSLYVEDDAAEGIAESISFLLDTAILIFAASDRPNTMDPSFMKTFVPMGGFMVPGIYQTEDGRDEVLKMDWSTEVKITNSAACARINATAA